MFGWLKRGGSPDTHTRGGDLPEPALTPAELRDAELTAYLDEDLAPEAVRDLEARLATDADLTEALDGLRLVRDTLATLEVVPAPRSFALTAPPAPERRVGFGWLDIAMRAGAMTAAVAFVVVLASDLSGGSSSTSTPVSDSAFSAVAESNAGGAAADLVEQSTLESTAAPPLSGSGADAAGDETDEAPASEPGDDVAPAATVTALPPTAEATVEAAAAASTELRASQGPAAPDTDAGASTGSEGSDPQDTTSEPGAADSAPGGAAVAPPPAAVPTQPAADATPPAAAADTEDSAGAAVTDETTAPDAADAARDGSAEDAGTTEPQPALGQQSGDTAPGAEESAGALLTEDGAEPSGLAIGLGVIAAGLAAVAGLLWWRGRSQTAGPA